MACLGHNNARVNAAIAEQLSSLAYVHSGPFTNQAAEALADIILDGEPGGLTHAFLVSSGSEAMEAALKLARQYFVEIGQPSAPLYRAPPELSRQHPGALAFGGNWRRDPYRAAAVGRVQPCPPRLRLSLPARGRERGAYVRRLADELEAEFQRLGPQNVAAFCAETVVGATTGCVAPPAGLFPADARGSATATARC